MSTETTFGTFVKNGKERVAHTAEDAVRFAFNGYVKKATPAAVESAQQPQRGEPEEPPKSAGKAEQPKGAGQGKPGKS